MSTNLQQIGTPLLDMDGIATQLHVKGPLVGITDDNLEQFSPFITLKDIEEAGSDSSLIRTIGVDEEGDPVKIGRLALAYTEEGSTDPEDRTTVRNAKLLNGKDLDYFYTKTAGTAGETHTTNLISRFNEEIKDLRAQQIMLMNVLAKNGTINTLRPMNGFYDTFRRAYPLHVYDYLGTAFRDSEVNYQYNTIQVASGEGKNFNVGDWVIVSKGTDLNQANNIKVAKISNKTGELLTLDGSTSFKIEKDSAHLFKSYGTVSNHSFMFGHFSEQQPGAGEIYTGVDDDNYRTRRRISANNTGYATTFRINPNRASGLSDYYLASVEISVRKVGTPGSLMCYIINAVNIEDFDDPQQAADDGILLAKSKPLVVPNQVGEQIVKFDFTDDTGQYPLLENIDKAIDGDAGRTRFCMIIEATTANSTNYYELLFLQHYDATTGNLTDLQTNNIVYKYTKEPTLELMDEDSFKTLTTDIDINKADLFYGVTLKPVEYSSFYPHAQGVYTAQFKTYEPIQVNNVRLAMRVAREGYFEISSISNTGNVRDGGEIRYIEDKNYREYTERFMQVDPFAVVSDTAENSATAKQRKIVVGTHVTEVSNLEGDRITIAKGTHISLGDPVYPMGYTASLMCYRRYWDTATHSWKETEHKKIDLDIKCVQPAFNEQEKIAVINNINDNDIDTMVKTRLMEQELISDYLIFEGDMDTTKLYNTFELQVYWRMMASMPTKSYSGRIFDLSVSLNRRMY